MATNKSNTPNNGVSGSSKSGNSNVSGNMSSSNTGSGKSTSGNISTGSSSMGSSNVGSSNSGSSNFSSGNNSSSANWSSGSSNPSGSAFGSMASSGSNANVSPEIVSTLNSLIETCKDGQLGFKDAADGVENSQLKSMFSQFSSQRAQFANELQDCVKSLGASPETSGHIAGTVHRGWLNIKSAITGHDEHAIIAECERGEDFAVKKYEEACSMNLPSQLKSVVERQYQQVKAAHDKIHNLDEIDGNVSTNLSSPGTPKSAPNVSGSMSSGVGSSSKSGNIGSTGNSSNKSGSSGTGSSSMSSKSGNISSGSNFNSNPTGTSGNMSSNSQLGGGNISGNMSSKNPGSSSNSVNKPDSRSQF